MIKLINKTVILVICATILSLPVTQANEPAKKTNDYSYLLNYRKAVSLPENSLDKSSIKIAIISDGVAEGIPGLPEVSSSYNAVTSTEYQAPDLLDYQALKVTPSTLGTFTAGILSSKLDDSYSRFKGILDDSKIISINIYDGVSTSDKIYSDGLKYAQLKDAAIILATSTPYDSLSLDKAKESCAEIKKLRDKGIITVTPVSSNYNYSTFSLADCADAVKVGYLDENLNTSSTSLARKPDYYLPGSDFLSYTLSSDQIPFGYSSSDLWSATLMAGIIGKLEANTTVPIETILKNINLGSVIIPQTDYKMPNYENTLNLINNKKVTNDFNSVSRDYKLGGTAMIKSLVSDGKSTEVSIKPLNSELKVEYQLNAYLYNDQTQSFSKVTHNFASSEVRFKFEQPFPSGSYVILKTLIGDREVESIPYSAVTIAKKEILSDEKSKLTGLSAKWVKEGIIIYSTTDSIYGETQIRELMIVDNYDWINLAQLEITNDTYLYRVPLNSELRKKDLGIGITLNISEKRILLPAYYNTTLTIASVNSKTSLITIKGAKDCMDNCFKKPAQLSINKKIYKVNINQSGLAYLYLPIAKDKVKSVILTHPYLKAPEL